MPIVTTQDLPSTQDDMTFLVGNHLKTFICHWHPGMGWGRSKMYRTFQQLAEMFFPTTKKKGGLMNLVLFVAFLF